MNIINMNKSLESTVNSVSDIFVNSFITEVSQDNSIKFDEYLVAKEHMLRCLINEIDRRMIVKQLNINFEK